MEGAAANAVQTSVLAGQRAAARAGVPAGGFLYKHFRVLRARLTFLQHVKTVCVCGPALGHVYVECGFNIILTNSAISDAV